MLDVLRFSSKATRVAILTGVTALLLSGCSTSKLEKSMYTIVDHTVTGSVEKSRIVKQRDTKPEDPVGLELNKTSAETIQALGINSEKLSGVRSIKESASCRYLRSSAASEATIIASPTASASTDDDGSGSVSLGMNLLDFRKAKLIRASGDAKCRLHEASKKIEATHGLGIEATKFAHAYAKQSYIRKNLGKLDGLKARARRLTQNGSITIQDRNLVGQRINELKSEMERFAAEANQRKNLPALEMNQIKSRHGALVVASNDLQTIEREIRTNDALELSVNTGYRFNETFNDTLQRRDNDGAYANVSVGVRLGALSPSRQRYEDEAAAAKLDALFEENNGAIWKSAFSKQATDRMIVDLQKSEKQLITAIAHNQDTINKLATADRPEIIRTRLTTKVENIRVSANLAAVRASIEQLRKNSQNIDALSQ